MAIKYKTSSTATAKDVTTVKFGSNDVKKIILDDTIVWMKPYTLTETSNDSSLVTYTWDTTEEPTAAAGGTISKSEYTKGIYKATVYHNDKIKVAYGSKNGYTVDSVRVDGDKISTGSTFDVSDNVLVDVAARGEATSLTISLDQGVNYMYIRYMDSEGQYKKVELEDSAQHTITDILKGSEVFFRIGCKSGHQLSEANTTYSFTDLKRRTSSSGNWTASSIILESGLYSNWYWNYHLSCDYKFTAGTNHTLTARSEIAPATLTIVWPISSISSVKVDYTKLLNGVATSESVTINQSNSSSYDTYDGETYYKYTISNVKYASSFYYSITPKSGTNYSFIFTEDYDTIRDSSMYIRLRHQYPSATIKLDWSNLDETISRVSVSYKRSDRVGTWCSSFVRCNGYSNIEDARLYTTANLESFKFTRAGCRVDDNDPKTKLYLDKNENIFRDVTVEVLDLDERPAPVTVTVPSGYKSITVYYITVDGVETSKTFTATSTITDAAEGSYFNYEGLRNDGTIVYGYYWLYKDGSGTWWWSTTASGSGSGSASVSGSVITHGGTNNVTSNTITPPSAATKPAPIIVENPVHRRVVVNFNPNIKRIYVRWYYAESGTNELKYTSRNIYPDSSTSAKNIDALVGYNVYWKAYGATGCIPSPEWESFRLTDVATSYLIDPTAVLTPGTIRVVYAANIKNIKVTYYITPTQTTTITCTADTDILDALIGTRYTWTAEAVDGKLERASGSGYVSKNYWESMIAPEIDTEPFDLSFGNVSGSHADWEDGYHSAADGDIISLEDDGTAPRVVCKTASGFRRWDNIVTVPTDDDDDDFEGYPTVAIYNYAGTKLIDLTTSATYTIKATDTTYYRYKINADGVTRVDQYYTIKLPTKPTNATEGYMHTSSTSTSGLPEDTTFKYGTKVYYFLVYPINYYNHYNAPSGWTKINTTTTHVTYRVDSTTVKPGCDTTSPFDASGEFTAKTWKVTLSGDHIYWTSNNKTVTSFNVYTGCKLSVTGTNTITCKAPGGTTLWYATAIRNADTTNYSYSGIPEIEGAAFFPIEINADTTIKAIGITRSTRKYTVQIKLPTNASSTYISTRANATSGTAVTSATAVEYSSSTYYGFVKVSNANALKYDPNPSWQYLTTSGSYNIYLVWSGKINELGTYDPGQLRAKAWTITLPTTYVNWRHNGSAVTYMTAYTDDVLSVSGTAITCYNSAGTRWKVSASRNANTAQYTYSGSPTLKVTSPVTGAQTVKVSGVTRTVNKYTVSITKPTYDGIAVRRAVVNTTKTPSNGSVGTNTSLTVDYGTTVYGFIVFDKGFDERYIVPSGWTLIHYDDSEEVWRVGSEIATTNCSIRYQGGPTRATGTVSITKASYMDSVYLNTVSGSLSGNQSGTTYNAGEIVYGFARLNSTNYNNYNTPSTWKFLGTSNGYYYYQIGSKYVYEGSNTFTYTNATEKPTLSAPSLYAPTWSGNYAIQRIFNPNPVEVTADVTYYSPSGYKWGTKTVVISANSTAEATYYVSQQSFYTTVAFWRAGYKSSTRVTSSTYTYTPNALSAPELVEGSLTTSSGITTGVAGYGFPYKMSLTIKNNNSVTVETEIIAVAGDFDCLNLHYQKIPANSSISGTLYVMNNSAIDIYFHADGYSSSCSRITASTGGGSGDGGDTAESET